MADELLGVAELTAKLKTLGDPKAQKKALRESVSVPMKFVMKAAKMYLQATSPGEAEFHRSYLSKPGAPRYLLRGFAQRSVRLRVSVTRNNTAAFAKLGVLKEAYYAVSFFERGTATIPARPWLVPAFEQSRSATLSRLAQTLKMHIERTAKLKGGSSRPRSEVVSFANVERRGGRVI